MHALEFYQKSSQLQPTTSFASFNIDNFCIRFSHQEAINALEPFLSYYVPDHYIQGMIIDKILQLVSSRSGKAIFCPQLQVISTDYWWCF
ncbi:unnamed protein product [Rotaria sp. Silwood2]|nr:unnamed protein product [Rotaria sp. Silwood2]CAF3165325.1 unnamed protein product [Rotaria sp. Silwood2]CAF4277680.1 unnamed protein product [Rotaria sp. Silwood2]CAF4315035.1 unnamed protein product [Rotaria sp. Silwood2]